MAGAPSKTTDPPVTKRKVTMRSATLFDGKVLVTEAVDYVRPDILDAYVTDAETRWQEVVVDPTPDAGPGGYHGETHVPARLAHPLAGQTFAATKKD